MKKKTIYPLLFFLLLTANNFLTSCNQTPSTSINVDTSWNGKCFIGTSLPKMYTGKIDDFYINSTYGDVYIKISENEWNLITNIDSLPYVYEDKWELNISYDGYFQVNNIITDALIKDYLKDNIIENTLGLKDNKYYGENNLISAKERIILMGNYKKYAKITHYNNIYLEEVSTYVKGIGTLEFGVFNLKTKNYSRKFKLIVHEGLNHIKLNMKINSYETLCIGGNESNVSLYVATNVDRDNQSGLFTVDQDKFTVNNDRLILKSKIKAFNEKSSFENISVYENEDISPYTNINYQGAPIILKDYEMFEGKTISKFKFPIDRVSEISSNYTLTVSILNQGYLENNSLLEHLVKEYPLDLTSYIGDITNEKVSKWIEVDVTSLNITIQDGQMIGFGKNTDNVLLCIDRSVHNVDYPEFNFYLPYYRNSIFTQNVFLDVYTIEMISLKQFLSNLDEIDSKAKSYCLNGLNASIFGDSISSYQGYSNDVNRNSTTKNNGTHYSGSSCGVTSVDQTWWMHLINRTGMNLLVNNSSAGDAMYSGGFSRCVQLHNNEGVMPDIICTFFGINDVWRSQVTFDDFKVNYPKLVSTIRNKYRDAELFFATYIPFYWYTGSDKDTIFTLSSAELEKYNQVVRDEVEKYDNCYLVDLFNDSGINYDNYKQYLADENGRWLHPNPKGMELISNTFYDSLIKNVK